VKIFLGWDCSDWRVPAAVSAAAYFCKSARFRRAAAPFEFLTDDAEERHVPAMAASCQRFLAFLIWTVASFVIRTGYVRPQSDKTG